MATDEELFEAREAARLAEAEAGRLRGEIVELKTQLARARQDQEAYQRVFDTKRTVTTEVNQWYREARGWLGTQRRKRR